MNMRRSILSVTLLILFAFCLVSMGGCGGSNSDSSIAPVSDDVQVPNNNDTPSTNPNNNDTPSTNPDNNSGNNTNPNSGEIVSSDINGTWRVDTGTFTMTVTGVGTNAMPYIQGSASASSFNIAATKNTFDEYYTVTLSGNGVHDTEHGRVTCEFDTGSWSQYMDGETEQTVEIDGGGNFTYSNNAYTYSMSGVPGSSDGNYMSGNASGGFFIMDSSTVEYREAINYSNMSMNLVITLKRVN